MANQNPMPPLPHNPAAPGRPAGAPPVPAVPKVPATTKHGGKAPGKPARGNSADDLLDSISQNFGGESTGAIAKAKRDSLAQMNKTLPDWSLEPPETFLS